MTVGCAAPSIKVCTRLLNGVEAEKVKKENIIASMHKKSGEIFDEKNRAEIKNEQTKSKKGVK